ncbi:MAG: tyrosine-type recombinase/integrase [Ruminiclostridium sp.]|nr:tyrosine-type recombinase/integrase [Ruminiclostridium sp.]
MSKNNRSIVKIGGAEIVASAPTQGAKWEEIVAYFIATQDVKESSRSLYARTLKLFFEWINQQKKGLNSLSRQDILAYKDALFAKGLSSLSVASYLTALRKFYEWAESEKLYPNIAKGVKTPRRVQTFKKQHLTEEKSSELLSHFESLSLRDYAIVNLILRTGLRTIEVVRADVGDITFKGNRRILRVWGKGHDSKDDFVVLTEKTYLPIKAYLATRKGLKANEPLFTSDSHRNTGERLTTRTISGLCKGGLKAIGLDGREFTAHSLRHTTAVTILKSGGSLTDAQTLLRHTTPTTTQIYTESIKEELRLKDAPESLIDNAF